MISLGGVIGQGLFLSAGANLEAAGKFIYIYNYSLHLSIILTFNIGPAGALIAYAIIGFIVFWVTFSLGEMATYIPVCNIISWHMINLLTFVCSAFRFQVLLQSSVDDL